MVFEEWTPTSSRNNPVQKGAGNSRNCGPDLGHPAGTGFGASGGNWQPQCWWCQQTSDTPVQATTSAVPWTHLPEGRQQCPAHARVRSPAERANAQLKAKRIAAQTSLLPLIGRLPAKVIHLLQACEI